MIDICVKHERMAGVAFLALVAMLYAALPQVSHAAVEPLSRPFLSLQGTYDGAVVPLANDMARLATVPCKNSPVRSELPYFATYVGYFRPSTSQSKLAIFSDDGCEIKVDGVLVHNRLPDGQHLPNLAASLWKLDYAGGRECPGDVTYNADPNRNYLIEVRYCNRFFTGDADVDGCALFAYDGGGTVVVPPPGAISIIEPRNGSSHPPCAIPIRATVADNAVGSVAVTIREGAAVIPHNKVGDVYTSDQWVPATAGTHTLTVEAYDPVTNVTTTASATINVEPLALIAEKTAVVAGAFDSPEHQCILTAVVPSTSVGNIEFAITQGGAGFDTPDHAALLKQLGLPGNRGRTISVPIVGGVAKAVLTSSDQTSNVVVEARMNGLVKTVTVACEAPTRVELSGDLVVGGMEVEGYYTTLTATLKYGDTVPIQGHTLEWWVRKVSWEDGTVIVDTDTDPASAEWLDDWFFQELCGRLLTDVAGQTDENGQTDVHYQSGYFPVIIQLGARDLTIHEP